MVVTMEAHAARLHWLARRHRAFFIIICALFLYQIGWPSGRRGHSVLSVCKHAPQALTRHPARDWMTGSENQWVGVDLRQQRSEETLIRIIAKAIGQACEF
jgi:hypothetical protein